ncbi:MAG: hypothetical protein IPO08_22930 [Xanthomonadales bacterium]|nr:hypothetical protein [Xanthomonadales bacterium]
MADPALEKGLRALLGDFSLYAAECLKVLPKEGGEAIPFELNRAQRYIHARLEQQLKETGKVRALLLKGRQQGGSTYIGARFYKRTSTEVGKGAFIIAHEDKATTNLFKMVKRFHLNNPLAPSTGATNAQELIFDKLDGGYKLATAGSKDVGRSNTVQYLHGSEVAFWKNASTHLAGIGNTVADMPGTEIILETTANGIGNTFHQLWQKAERGEGEYIAIFVPWFWQDEYQAKAKEGFEDSLSDADREYMQAYGLTLAQMQWRANKIATYDDGDEWLFDQEYPATPALAFQTSSTNPLISPALVNAAKASTHKDSFGAIVIGCDPASDSDSADRTAIAWRRGRTILRTETYQKKDEMQIAGILANYWKNGDGKGRMPDAIFIDKGGIGGGIVSRLKELNIPVIGVMFGERATEDDIYANKRAEMWWRLRDWFKDHPCRIPANCPALEADLSAPQKKLSSNGRKLLESKEDMEARGVRSPDLGDAAALTFAEPVLARSSATLPASSGHHAPSAAGY